MHVLADISLYVCMQDRASRHLNDQHTNTHTLLTTEFVHTCRMGRSGTAYSLLTRDELPYLLDLHLYLGRQLLPAPLALPAPGQEPPQQPADGASWYGSIPQVGWGERTGGERGLAGVALGDVTWRECVSYIVCTSVDVTRRWKERQVMCGRSRVGGRRRWWAGNWGRQLRS